MTLFSQAWRSIGGGMRGMLATAYRLLQRLLGQVKKQQKAPAFTSGLGPTVRLTRSRRK